MPRAPKVTSDDNTSILEYALSHLEREAAELQARIEHVKRQLGKSVKVTSAPAAASARVTAEDAAPAAVAGTRKKRTLSPAARKRIALAQKKRWAAHRKAAGAKE